MPRRARGKEWFRKEYQGREEELETRMEFEARRGLEPGTLGYRFYDYADIRPKKVMEDGRTIFYVRSELDEFYDDVNGRKKPRTRAEKLKAEIVRAKGTVRDCEESAEAARRVADKWDRRTAAKKKNLRRLEEYLAIEVSIATQTPKEN